MKKIFIVLFLFSIALSPALLGIFHRGFFLTDDGNWMAIRLSAFYEALRQGQFPVRFLPRLNNGFGYPVSDFNYPLFLYFGSFIHIFHIQYFETIKLLFGLSIIASSIGCFFWLRRRFGDMAGFVGALVYTLFPYHVWDITKRGSLGEIMAFGIVPFIFLFIDTENIVLSAITIGLLILSHNTLALFFLPIIFFYVGLERKIHQGIFSFLLGFGLSAFFWLPALFDTQYTVFSRTIVANFNQYFLSSDLYPLIGIISFFILLFSLVLVYKKVSTNAVFFLVVGLLSVSLTNKISQPLWDIVHLGKYIQFPFRFLSVTAICVGFLAAYSIHVQRKYKTIFIGIILVLLYISSWQFFFAKSYQMYPDTYYSTNEDSTTIHNEYMPIWVKKLPTFPQRITASPEAIITRIDDKGSSLSLQINTKTQTMLTIPRVYFPGWQARVDDKFVVVLPNYPFGFINLVIPPGAHNISVWFGETVFRLIADGISIISLLIVIGWYILKKKGNYV